MLKSKNGITLIALIITIVVLLVIAGVVVNLSLGQNGMISKAQIAVGKYENEQEKESMVVADYEKKIDNARGTVTIDEEEYKQLLEDVKKLKENVGYPDFDNSEIILSTKNRGNGDFITSGEDTYVIKDDGYLSIMLCIRNGSFFEIYIDDVMVGQKGVRGLNDALWESFLYKVKKGSTIKIISRTDGSNYRINYNAYFVPIV